MSHPTDRFRCPALSSEMRDIVYSGSGPTSVASGGGFRLNEEIAHLPGAHKLEGGAHPLSTTFIIALANGAAAPPVNESILEEGR